jgi:hypothetical protein
VIIDPNTGRTVDHDTMLQNIEDWTKDRSIQKAMLTSGTADIKGLVTLVAAVRLANESKRGGLTEVQAAAVILQLLGAKKVRRAIAKHVSEQYGLNRWEVTSDLLAFMEHCAELIPEERPH